MAPFRGYLEGELQKHTGALITLNEDRAVHVAQGHARALSALLRLINESPELLDPARQR
jgi:sugar diacid utilization regulator